MNCKKVLEELIFRFADDEMEQELRVEFKRHVADCPHCARQAQYTRRLLMVVRQRATRCAAPTHLRERILAALPHRRDLRT